MLNSRILDESECRLLIDLINKYTTENTLNTTALWNDPLIVDIKRKIKDDSLIKQKRRCCYCRRQMIDEHYIVIDIEHILPKSKFPTEIFTEVNLSTSCKRCNMRYKRERIKFYSGGALPHYDSNLYLFVHPNLDRYNDHIIRTSHELDDDHAMVKYEFVDNSAKGKYLYDFFRLDRLEYNSLDCAQGVPISEDLEVNLLDQDDETLQLLDDIEQ